MATTSFSQKFYIAPENTDEFVRVVTAPPQKHDKPKFQSRATTNDELRKYTLAVSKKNGRV